MEEATEIPEETEVPRHRGEAYTDFEKKIADVEVRFNGITVYLKKSNCITINVYPEGESED